MLNPQPSLRAKLVVLSCALIFAVGLVLDSLFGKHFLVEYPMPTVVLVPVLGLSALGVMWLPGMQEQLRQRYPTFWVRCVLWPAFVLLLAGLLYLSGRGWLSGISRVLVRGVETRELVVVSNERWEGRRSVCLQQVALRYKAEIEKMCADPLLVDGSFMVGPRVMAFGLASPLGFHIRQLGPP